MTTSNLTHWAKALAFTLAAGLGACAQPDDDGADDDAELFCLDNSDCYNGQTCDEGMCVAAGPADDPNATNPTGNDPTGNDPTGNDPTGNDPTGSSPTGGDPTGPDPTGGDPTGADPSPSCEEGSFECIGSSIEACENGQIESYSCADVCASQGWTTSGCNGDQRACDGYLDEECALGVSAFCVCYEALGESCSEQDMQDFYLQCYQGQAPEFSCFENYVANNQVDCEAAVTACL